MEIDTNAFDQRMDMNKKLDKVIELLNKLLGEKERPDRSDIEKETKEALKLNDGKDVTRGE